MAKMRKYLFWNEAGDEKEVEKMSLKKALSQYKVIIKIKWLVLNILAKKAKKL